MYARSLSLAISSPALSPEPPFSSLPLRPRSTRSDKKKDDILAMGADHVIATGEEGWLKREKLAFELDFIISVRPLNSPTLPPSASTDAAPLVRAPQTVDVASGVALNDLLPTLVVEGKFISVGLPDHDLEGVHPMAFLGNGCSFGATHIGSKKEVRRRRGPCLRRRTQTDDLCLSSRCTAGQRDAQARRREGPQAVE